MSVWTGLIDFLFGSAWRREGRVLHFEGVLPVELADINARRARKRRKPIEPLLPGAIDGFGKSRPTLAGRTPPPPAGQAGTPEQNP